ncbi:MAG TPA: class I SAM-dependent methyltransferase [Ktedonobacterales bacterium]|nr:class I SAM-dependent methyltransferase [Ktedonobacterales bacterium]
MEREDIPGVMLDPEGAETRTIHELIDFSGKNVLEIGCGDGRLTRRFAAETSSVLAVDLDTHSIALAHARLPESLRPKVTFQVANITTVELPSAAFDVAVLSWSL